MALGLCVMVLLGYFSVAGVLRRRLEENSRESLYTAEESIRAGFSQGDLLLTYAFHMVRGLIDRGGGDEAVRTYLSGTNGWLGRSGEGLPGFRGLHGFIRGRYFDIQGNPPDSFYNPRETLWYRAAEKSGREAAYTTPYLDGRTGVPVVSIVRNLYSREGEYYGVLALDLEVAWLAEYVHSHINIRDSFGMLISGNMRVAAHPGNKSEGLLLRELGGGFRELEKQLFRGELPDPGRIRDETGRSLIVFVRRLFNGWYAVQFTEEKAYYRELTRIAVDLSFLGVVLALILGSAMVRTKLRELRAGDASRSKSDFFANMSHEIRTPLNAIIGMSELALLNAEAPAEVPKEPGALAEYLVNIKRAGSNLLSIINDILDLSKIESGSFHLTEVPYRMSSLLNNVVNVIRVRFHEKPVLFLADIDPRLPDKLIGDEVRIRQILFNMLSNAVKYTEEGYIRFTVRGSFIS
ncbi:MAG: histidine kinase, partial [Treponema sp.]|nr:histidine kinase [Treponema sp.]